MSLSMEEYADQNALVRLTEKTPKEKRTKQELKARLETYYDVESFRYRFFDDTISPNPVVLDERVEVTQEQHNQLFETYFSSGGEAPIGISRVLPQQQMYEIGNGDIVSGEVLRQQLGQVTRRLVDRAEREGLQPTEIPVWEGHQRYVQSLIEASRVPNYLWSDPVVPIHCIDFNGNEGRGTVFESLDGGHNFSILDEPYLYWLNHQSETTLSRILIMFDEPDGSGLRVEGRRGTIEQLQNAFNLLDQGCPTSIQNFREWVENNQIPNSPNISESLNEDTINGVSELDIYNIAQEGSHPDSIPDWCRSRQLTPVNETEGTDENGIPTIEATYEEIVEQQVRNLIRNNHRPRSPRYG